MSIKVRDRFGVRKERLIQTYVVLGVYRTLDDVSQELNWRLTYLLADSYSRYVLGRELAFCYSGEKRGGVIVPDVES